MSTHPGRPMRPRMRGEEGSTLVLALVMIVAFGMVALAAGRYATTNMADTVVTRDRTRQLEAAAGGARIALAVAQSQPDSWWEHSPVGTSTVVAVPGGLNGAPVDVELVYADPAVRKVTVTSTAGDPTAGHRTVRATALVGFAPVGQLPPVAITSWVTDEPA